MNCNRRTVMKIIIAALIAAVDSSELGANIHASIGGRVGTISESWIDVEA